MVLSFPNWRWCLLLVAACLGCSSARPPLSQPPSMASGPLTLSSTSPSGLSSLLRGRKEDVSAANNAAAQSTRSIPVDDPLSLRYMPTQLGANVHVRAAQVLESKGKFDQALDSYAKALEVGPTDLGALVGLARLHDRRGNYAVSNQWYERALSAHPSVAAVYNDYGLCLARQGQTTQAIEVMREAVRIEPRQALYRNNIAQALVDQRRIDEAVEHLTAVFPPAAAHYNLGFLLRQSGQTETAMMAFQRSLDIDPAFARANTALELCRADISQPTRSAALPFTNPTWNAPSMQAQPTLLPPVAGHPR